MTLRRRSLFAALFGWTLFVTSSHAASLSATKGTVEIKKSGAALWTQAKTKDGVKAGDVLRTGAGSSAELSTAEGHRVQMREKTTARVDSSDNGDSRFYLEVGRLRSKVAKLRGRQKFEIRTPLAVASVRGTTFDVEVGEDKTSRLFVVEGAVAYKELAGVAPEVLVPAGQDFTFTPPPADKPADGNPGTGDKDKTDKGDRNRPLDKEPKEKDPKSKDMEKSEKEKEKDLRYAEKERKEKEMADKESEKERKEKEIASRDVKSDLLKEELKREILRETEISLQKDFSQSDVAQDLKQEQAEVGRVFTDSFGRRVRFEDYIKRPTANSFSYVAISERDKRVDTHRTDVIAAKDLPKDLSQVDLFRGNGKGFTNWAVAVQITNDRDGLDYYREWWEGGFIRNMDGSTIVGPTLVFTDGYAEVGGEKGATLLSHWVPDSSFAGGNPDPAVTRALTDLARDGGLDAPFGYVEADLNQSRVVGDVRAGADKVSLVSLQKKQDLFMAQDTSFQSYYRASEGYERTTLGDKSLSGVQSMAEWQKARDGLKVFSLAHSYALVDSKGNPTGQSLDLRVDRYIVSEQGDIYPRYKAAPGGALVDGFNAETVYSSSLFLNGDVDTIVTPLLNRNSGLQTE